MQNHQSLVVSVIQEPTDRISSPLTSKEWGFTCPKCDFVPGYSDVDDYIRVMRQRGELRGITRSVNLRFPHRCKSCEAAKKRTSRLKKSITRVFGMSAGIGAFLPTYNFPKLITFALIDDYYSSGNPSADRSKLIQKLNSKLPKVWKLLGSKGTLGGTFVLECSTRLIWSDLATEPQMWRHHPHVHCVAVSNFVHHSKLVEYCESLLPLGLGRINLKAPKSSKPVANYIGKYLAKDGFRARTFGVMRKIQQWEKQCYCKHDDMEINTQYCQCIVSGL